MACAMSFSKNNIFPSLDPRGTPHLKSGDAENLSLIFTWKFLLEWYDVSQSIISFENPRENIFCIIWCIVSNVFWRSIKFIYFNEKTRPKSVWYFISEIRWQKFVQWFFQKPDWNLYKILYLLKNTLDFLFIVLYKTFDTSGRRKIGC